MQSSLVLIKCPRLLTIAAEKRAAKYNPAAMSKLPLKPMVIDEMAASTVPITEAITLTPQRRVTTFFSLLSYYLILFMSLSICE